MNVLYLSYVRMIGSGLLSGRHRVPHHVDSETYRGGEQHTLADCEAIRSVGSYVPLKKTKTTVSFTFLSSNSESFIPIRIFTGQVFRTLQLHCRSARRTWKVNLPTNHKGYDNSETTVGKLSAKRIQIFRVQKCCFMFHLLFQKNFANITQKPPDPANLDLPC